MPAQIQIVNVTKEFGKNVILDKVSLDIPARKIYGIIGESGSGKTTLLKTIIGYWKPDDGEVLYEGRSLEKDMKFIKQIVGFATQDNCVYPKLTVRENLEYFGSMSNVPSNTLERNTDKILELVELKNAENKLAEELSGGMMRRLDIACALIHNPKILILDEPTQDLDPLLRKDIMNLIRKINENDTTIILTSHLLEETDQLCDEVAIIHEGRVLEAGTPEQLKNNYSKNEEIHLITRERKYKTIMSKLKDSGIKGSSVEGNSLIIYSDNAEKTLYHVLRAVDEVDKLIEVDLKKPTLTEVFENLTKRERAKKEG